jgi:hypothetical protein
MLKLVFELKFLDVFMGREDPIEFDIFLVSFWCLFLYESWVNVLLG